MALESRGEVELAKFAKENSQNAKVKEFAEMMITDHTAFLEKLRKF